MAWTEPTRFTAAARTYNDVDYWNAYLKGNLTEIQAHAVADAATHGLGAGIYPVGLAQGYGYHIETFTASGETGAEGGDGWGPHIMRRDWKFTKAFKSNPIVFMGVECNPDGTGANYHIPTRRVAGVTPQGCELIIRIYNPATRATMWGLAIGLEPDADAAPPQLIAWRQPRTFAAGYLTYEAVNTHGFVIPQWLYRNHLNGVRGAHGMPPDCFPLGHASALQHMEAQRYPAGDVGTQVYTSSLSQAMAFKGAYQDTGDEEDDFPAVITAAEYDSLQWHTQYLTSLSRTGVTINHTFGRAGDPDTMNTVHVYGSLLTLGPSDTAASALAGWTNFGADKGAGDTLSVAEWNTYVRDNEIALLSHHSGMAGMHGVSADAFLLAAARAGLEVWGQRQTFTAADAAPHRNQLEFTWGAASETCAILHSTERVNGDFAVTEELLYDVASDHCHMQVRHTGSGDGAMHVVWVGKR
jgi:hypothetical protein